MTDIHFEDSNIRRLLHVLTNCHQALWGYCELGELDKAVAMTHECQGELTEIRLELQRLKADDAAKTEGEVGKEGK
jgi:hypothetical protein